MSRNSSPAFERINPDGDPGVIFVCDHASNALPSEYGTLGLTPGQLQTHIAFDIGAADVTKEMAFFLKNGGGIGGYLIDDTFQSAIQTERIADLIAGKDGRFYLTYSSDDSAALISVVIRPDE